MKITVEIEADLDIANVHPDPDYYIQAHCTGINVGASWFDREAAIQMVGMAEIIRAEEEAESLMERGAV